MVVIEVKVIPDSDKNELAKEDSKVKIRVKASAEKGKANQAVIKLLSKYYNISKSSIKIIKAFKKPPLNKRITSNEYNYALELAKKYGLNRLDSKRPISFIRIF
ncbi:unnamed protein product [marine sediment metagenome]|uniref:Uncharacterized protein n=2 Tax=marine sediment metagenome TaxID=412755 RepID=X1ARD9_9ZZZZ